VAIIFDGEPSALADRVNSECKHFPPIDLKRQVRIVSSFD
jgi:hypothetical protein